MGRKSDHNILGHVLIEQVQTEQTVDKKANTAQHKNTQSLAVHRNSRTMKMGELP